MGFASGTHQQVSSATAFFIERMCIMGKGDLRTRKGKINNGSYGKRRPGRTEKKSQETAPTQGKSGRK